MSLRDEFCRKVRAFIRPYCVDRGRPYCPSPKNPLCKRCEEDVDALLSLRDDEGHRLAIVKEGAELPENPYTGVPGKYDERGVWREAQSAMRKDGWVKEVTNGDDRGNTNE